MTPTYKCIIYLCNKYFFQDMDQQTKNKYEMLIKAGFSEEQIIESLKAEGQMLASKNLKPINSALQNNFENTFQNNRVSSQQIMKHEDELSAQYYDQAMLRSQLEIQQQIQSERNKSRIEEKKPVQSQSKKVQQKIKPQPQMPAQEYTDENINAQLAYFAELQMKNRAKSQSQALKIQMYQNKRMVQEQPVNYGINFNLAQLQKLLKKYSQPQSHYAKQWQYKRQYQSQSEDQGQQNNYKGQPQPLKFVPNHLINIYNQPNQPNKKFLRMQKEKVLKSQKISVNKFYLKYKGELYQIQCQPLRTALCTKSGQQGFLQFISAQLDFKIQIKLRQIDSITYSKRDNCIYVQYECPQRFYQMTKQFAWDRIQNQFVMSDFRGKHSFENQIILKSLFHKKLVLKIIPQNINSAIIELRKVCKYVSEENNGYKFGRIQALFAKYKQSQFITIFNNYKNVNPIHSHQVQFSLVSLLYMSDEIEIDQIFQFAQFLNQLISADMDEPIWRIVTNLHPKAIYYQLRSKTLSEIFLNILQQENSRKVKRLSKNLMRCPTFKVTPSGIIPSGWSVDTRNRLSRHYRDFDHQFMKIQVSNDDYFKTDLFQCRQLIKPTLQKLLGQIKFLQSTYEPLGWTQSQLKAGSMWYTLKSDSTAKYIKSVKRQELLNFLGDFAKFQYNPALKAARVGQNLSSIGVSVDVSGVQMVVWPDDRSERGMLFTDGIGCISADVIKKIQKQLGTQSTAFQVRFRGCKGMLVLNRNLGPNTIAVRESMQKFLCPNKDSWKYFDIIAKNSYSAGVLNHQIIILLSINGIPRRNFIELQHQHVQNQIQRNHFYQNFDGKNTFECNKDDKIQIESIGQLMNKIVKTEPGLLVNEPTLRGVLTQKHIAMFEKLINKGHIKVQKSARLLGIIDEYQILNEGEVYCCVVNNEKEKQTVVGRAMLTRNPCMHPADIRVVDCISDQEAARRFKTRNHLFNYFEQLPNCIIFPKRGNVPLTAQISGSDLDGDEFFISWDKRLVPTEVRQPYMVDDVKATPRRWQGTGYKQTIKFFCEFIFNNQLGRMANSHLVWADQQGADCDKCIELCKQYGKALDYAKKGYEFNFNRAYWITKYPHFMQKPEKETYQSRSILGLLFDLSVQKFESFKKQNNQANYQQYSLKQFRVQQYSDKQIESAFQIVVSFQSDMSHIIRKNRLERESQVYRLKVNQRQKQSKRQVYEKNALQLKYFHKFFRGLGIQDPIEYYSNFRQKKQPITGAVRRKLILWYQISNLPHQKRLANYKIKDWISKISRISHNRSDQIQYVGLPWFVVPSLMFEVLSQQL